MTNEPTAPVKDKDQPKAKAPKQVKEKKAKASKAQPKAKKASTGEFIALADIARTLGIEPKVARAKARRHDEIAKLAQGDAWAFKPADVAKVKAFLKG
jgi:hypothetical protein